jgi:hypothetical protein
VILCANAQEMDATQVTQTPRLTPLSLSNLCAEYLRDCFRIKLNARSSIAVATAPTVPPRMLPVPLALELNRIAGILVDRFLNRGQSHMLRISGIIF